MHPFNVIKYKCLAIKMLKWNIQSYEETAVTSKELIS